MDNSSRVEVQHSHEHLPSVPPEILLAEEALLGQLLVQQGLYVATLGELQNYVQAQLVLVSLLFCDDVALSFIIKAVSEIFTQTSLGLL